MTWPAILCALLVVGAAMLAVDRAMREPWHWPIAALLCVWMLDPMRPDSGPWGRAWLLVLPALSAAVGSLVLMRSGVAGLVALGTTLLCGGSELRRSGDAASALLFASAVSLVAQAMAALVASRRRLAFPDQCALALLAGDVAALAGPLADVASVRTMHDRWWLAQVQAAIVAGLLCALHIALPIRGRRG